MTPRERYAAIVQQVAAERGIAAEGIMGRSHARSLAYARHDAWYRLRRITGWTYPRMAKVVGSHHTTIITGIEGHCARTGRPHPDESSVPMFKSVRAA